MRLSWLVIGVLVGCDHAPTAASDAAIPDASHRPDGADLVDAAPTLDAASPDAAIDARCLIAPGSGEPGPLGMNDISFLVPLSAAPASSTVFARMDGLSPGSPLITTTDFQQIVGNGYVIESPYASFHVVAFRFDLCDRVTTASCDPTSDGQLRLTFQPLRETSPTRAADTAFHASYRIPAADLAAVVHELRVLARLRDLDPSLPLAVNDALACPPGASAYAARMRSLVEPLATPERLIRLTVATQRANYSDLHWSFFLFEPVNGQLLLRNIPGINIEWENQDLNVYTPGPSFNAGPIADHPSGLTLAMDNTVFSEASTSDRQRGLEALAASLNPRTTAFSDTQCMACHIATSLMTARTQQAGVAPSSVAGVFTSTHDLSIANGITATDTQTMRAFGWRDEFPEISQRVANDTAMVLDDINARFPLAITMADDATSARAR